MGFFDLFKREAPIQKKNYATTIEAVYDYISGGTTDIDPAKDANFFKNGYLGNPVVYRCISEIAGAISHLTFEVVRSEEKEDKVLEDPSHPLMAIVTNPSRVESHFKFLNRLIKNYLIFGRAFIYAPSTDGKPPTSTPQGYEIINPMKVKLSDQTYANGMPKFYEYTIDESKVLKFEIDMFTGHSAILGIYNPDPCVSLKGVSPLSPANKNFQTLNKASDFNHSLINNAARPSGLLKTENELSNDAFNRLVEHTKKYFTGTNNAGNVPLLEGGLEWQQTSLSPSDMEFEGLTDKQVAFIAMVFGVPLPLVLTDAATYSNQRDARISLYEDTALPIADYILEEISNWLHNMGVDQKDSLRVNEDRISALSYRREQAFDKAKTAVDSGLLTINEARKELGYPDITGMADILMVPSGRTPIDALTMDDDTEIDDVPIDDDEV